MEDEWDVVRNDRSGWPSGTAGVGILRITLLFGSAAVALALIIAPFADSQTRSYTDNDRGSYGLDATATGSIGGSSKVYTIHKSVLQSSPDAICVIRNGQRTGDC
jgi:hypothetical protein